LALVSFGREYSGARISGSPTGEGFEAPLLAWLPQIAIAGMAVYTATSSRLEGQRVRREPSHRRHRRHGPHRTRGIQRQDRGNPPESMLTEAAAAGSGSASGPDGFLYALTDEVDTLPMKGALLRIEPAP
jgi:glucose/arabinose dehydrogenase